MQQPTTPPGGASAGVPELHGMHPAFLPLVKCLVDEFILPKVDAAIAERQRQDSLSA